MEYPKGNTFTIPEASRNFPLAWDKIFLEPAISKPLIMFLISKGTFDPYFNLEIDSLDLKKIWFQIIFQKKLKVSLWCTPCKIKII
jgi:hypothetical protein